jgi:hypothetical protein
MQQQTHQGCGRTYVFSVWWNGGDEEFFGGTVTRVGEPLLEARKALYGEYDDGIVSGCVLNVSEYWEERR